MKSLSRPIRAKGFSKSRKFFIAAVLSAARRLSNPAAGDGAVSKRSRPHCALQMSRLTSPTHQRAKHILLYASRLQSWCLYLTIRDWILARMLSLTAPPFYMKNLCQQSLLGGGAASLSIWQARGALRFIKCFRVYTETELLLRRY